MPSKARMQTDRELLKMERKLEQIYGETQAELIKDWDTYMLKHQKKLNDAYEVLQEAIKSGDKDAIEKAKEDYIRIGKNMMVNDKRYKGLVDETTAKLEHTNEVALSYVNNEMPKVYAINYNELGNVPMGGYSFSLTNENAVKKLAQSKDIMLPYKELDPSKDIPWNKKAINSQMMQGLLKGDSIPKLAKRMENVTDMDKNAAIRNARTMTTAAENVGKLDSYKKAEEDGVILHKQWVAIHDQHTRASHAELDTEIANVDEEFSNGLMYPADPSGEPEEVYNCRCTMKMVYGGFRRS